MKKILITITAFLTLTYPCQALIADEFAEQSLDRNLEIRKYKPCLIFDNFAETNKQKSVVPKKIVIKEELPILKQNNLKTHKRNFIFDENRPRVQIKILEKISTKTKPEEGSEVIFETVNAIEYKNKIYPAGTKVIGRIETVSPNFTQGVPADLIIGNFYLDTRPLYGEISKTGANRSLWLKPVSYAVSPFFGAGLLLMLIRGGHAKIKPDEVFTVSF